MSNVHQIRREAESDARAEAIDEMIVQGRKVATVLVDAVIALNEILDDWEEKKG